MSHLPFNLVFDLNRVSNRVHLKMTEERFLGRTVPAVRSSQYGLDEFHLFDLLFELNMSVVKALIRVEENIRPQMALLAKLVEHVQS